MHDQPIWRIWIVLVAAVALQTTWLARWEPFGTHIDLPLLTVVSVALLLGWETGAAYGLAAGLLTGYFVGTNLGSWALSRMVAGGVFGLSSKGFSRDNPLAPPLCAAGAVLLANLVFLVMSPTDFPVSWWVYHTLVTMGIHAILIWPLHWLIHRFMLPPTRLMFG
jgi:rod shape-determining protein MreD